MQERIREGTISISNERPGLHKLPFVWQPSYGSSVINPDSRLLESYMSGLIPGTNSEASMVLLVPLQGDGKCAADCKECVFANHSPYRTQTAFASPIDADTFRETIQGAQEFAERSGLLSPYERYRVNPLLSGDPSFNGFTKQLILETTSNARISASRWSTIGMDTVFKPLTQFEEAAMEAASLGYLDNHKLRFQVSLQSTDLQSRMDHVMFHSIKRSAKLSLIPMEEISNYFDRIQRITGYASTLAFVVHKDSVIDPEVLADNFSIDSTWISLRPIITEDSISMAKDQFIDLYFSIRDKGFNVVMMPTIDGSEQRNLLA